MSWARHSPLVLGLAAVIATLAFLSACTTETITRVSPVAGDGAPPGENGGEPTPQDAGDAEAPPTATKDGLRLTVSEVTAALDVGSDKPAAGNEFVVIGLRLENVGSITPVAAAFPLFTLVTTNALVHSVHVSASMGLAKECSQTTSIDKGGVIDCLVIFEAKPNAAKELRYRTNSGASLAVPVPPVKRCHALPQLASAVPVTVTSFLADPFYPEDPPPGTYKLLSGTSETGGTLRARTVRLGASTIEETYTLEDGIVLQRTAAYAPDPSSSRVKLTPSCVSPYSRAFSEIEDNHVGYDSASQTVVEWAMQSGRATYVYRMQKVP